MAKQRKPWKQRYREHMQSAYWRELKAKVILRRGHKCERCFRTDCSLDLHHKHYKTFGRERQKDVELVCRECHRDADKQRAIEGMVRAALHRVDRGIESDFDLEVLSNTVWRKAKDGTPDR